jgi:hypothetical protein
VTDVEEEVVLPDVAVENMIMKVVTEIAEMIESLVTVTYTIDKDANT